MRTASLSILITFFLGIFAAWGVMSIKNRLWRFVWDGILTLPLVLPPTVAGFFLLYIFGVKRPVGQRKNRLLLGGHGDRRRDHVLSTDVPVGPGRL